MTDYKASDQSRSDFGRMSDEDTPAIHIYPQDGWHADAWIVGNRVGLQALRDSIDRALETGKPKVCEAFPCDGEGYGILVAEFTDDQIQELHVPYYEQSGWTGKGKHPYEIIGSARYRLAMTPEEEAEEDMLRTIEREILQAKNSPATFPEMVEDLKAYEAAKEGEIYPSKHEAGLMAVMRLRRARKEATDG